MRRESGSLWSGENIGDWLQNYMCWVESGQKELSHCFATVELGDTQ